MAVLLTAGSRREIALHGADQLHRGLGPLGLSGLQVAQQPFLVGRAVFISFVTVAELRYGARRAGW